MWLDECVYVIYVLMCFFFQAEGGIRDLVRSRGLGDVYKRQLHTIDQPVIDFIGKNDQVVLLRDRGDFSHARMAHDRARRVVRITDEQGLGAWGDRRFDPVSYTHLTLPPSDLV